MGKFPPPSSCRLLWIGLLLVLITLLYLGVMTFGLSPGQAKAVLAAPNYRGIWMPAYGEVYRALHRDVARLKSLGVNTISFGPQYTLGEDDSLSLGRIRSNSAVSDADYTKLIDLAHRSGFKVFLAPNTMRPGAPLHPRDVGKFKQKMSVISLHWAKLAQKHQVELYAPLNEPALIMPPEVAYRWGRSMVEPMRSVYNGKLVFKTHNLEGPVDFRGYDFASFDLFPGEQDLREPEEWRNRVRDELARGKDLARKQGCRGIMIGEFGAITGSASLTMMPVASATEQAWIYRVIFEECFDSLDGIFACGWTLPGFGFRGKPAESVVRQWYGQNGAIPSGDAQTR